MAAEVQGTDLAQIVALLGAGVIAVPLFKRTRPRLGDRLSRRRPCHRPVGPQAVHRSAGDPACRRTRRGDVPVRHRARRCNHRGCGGLRREIFGLGLAQVVACGALLTLLGILAGLPAPAAFVGGLGFVLTSTATVMQLLGERAATPHRRPASASSRSCCSRILRSCRCSPSSSCSRRWPPAGRASRSDCRC